MTIYRLPEEHIFPHPEEAEPDGLLAVDGDLSADRLLLAYANGIFPWYNEGEPILWWSPDPRCVLYPKKLKRRKSFRQKMRNTQYTCSLNRDFPAVIHACRDMERNKTGDTWITREILTAYEKLHEKGFAWSVETWMNGRLAGGLYGVKFGGLFSGESMFHYENDASKFALDYLCCKSNRLGIYIIDAQMETSHLKYMGAECIPRKHYLEELKKCIFTGTEIQDDPKV